MANRPVGWLAAAVPGQFRAWFWVSSLLAHHTPCVYRRVPHQTSFPVRTVALQSGCNLCGWHIPGNAYLTVGHLPHRATVLGGYPNRVISLLDHSRFINQGHPIHFSQRLIHQPLMNGRHWLWLPRALTDKVLHAAGFIPPVQRHPLHILARRIPQQAPQVGFAPFQLFRSLKGKFKQLDIVRHFFQKLLNILLSQIAFWRRAGFSYNFRRHGFPLLLPTWPWSEKDTMPFAFRLPDLSVGYIAL